jgi:hypothetical protein
MLTHFGALIIGTGLGGLSVAHLALRAFDRGYGAGRAAGIGIVLDAWAERSGATHEELKAALAARRGGPDGG